MRGDRRANGAAPEPAEARRRDSSPAACGRSPDPRRSFLRGFAPAHRRYSHEIPGQLVRRLNETFGQKSTPAVSVRESDNDAPMSDWRNATQVPPTDLKIRPMDECRPTDTT